MFARVSFLLLALVFLGACASTDETASTPPEDVSPSAENVAVPLERIERRAAERYGEEAAVTYIPNAAETHVLVLHRRPATASHPIPETSYFVYDVQRDEVVIAEQALPGTVRWVDDQYLHVQFTPGTVQAQGETANSYRVDVYTGDRVRTDAK